MITLRSYAGGDIQVPYIDGMTIRPQDPIWNTLFKPARIERLFWNSTYPKDWVGLAEWAAHTADLFLEINEFRSFQILYWAASRLKECGHARWDYIALWFLVYAARITFVYEMVPGIHLEPAIKPTNPYAVLFRRQILGGQRLAYTLNDLFLMHLGREQIRAACKRWRRHGLMPGERKPQQPTGMQMLAALGALHGKTHHK